MNGIPTAKTGETKPSNFCSSTSERTKSQPRLKRRRNRKPEAPKGKRRTGDATATNELRPSTAAARSAPLSSSSLPSDATRANPSPHCERVEAARTEALEEVAIKETSAPKQLKPPLLCASLSATTTASSTSARPRPPQHRPDRRRPRNYPLRPSVFSNITSYATLWMGKRI